MAFVPTGTTDWQALVRGSATVVPTIQQGTTGLSFIVPSDFPAGVYGFEIKESFGSSGSGPGECTLAELVDWSSFRNRCNHSAPTPGL